MRTPPPFTHIAAPVHGNLGATGYSGALRGLGALHALAALGAKQKLAPFQRRLLYTFKQYRNNPDVAILTAEVIWAAYQSRSVGTQPRLAYTYPTATLQRDLASALQLDHLPSPQEVSEFHTRLLQGGVHYGGTTYPNTPLAQRMATLAPWVAAQVNAALKRVRRGKPVWAVGDVQYEVSRSLTLDPVRALGVPAEPLDLTRNEVGLQLLLRDMAERLGEVVDWVAEDRPDLGAYNWAAAKRATRAYHARVEEEAERLRRAAIEGELRPSPVVATADNGWTLQELDSSQALTQEGAYLRHCVGGSGYWDDIHGGHTRIYSLRATTPNGNQRPLYTVEAHVSDASDNAWRAVQIKGRFNAVPPFQQKKGAAGRSNALDPQERLEHCTYLLQALQRAGIDTNHVHDLHLCKEIVAAEALRARREAAKKKAQLAAKRSRR